MQEYYFLFLIVFIWMIFATLQDLKTREIYNWLNFSLLSIALSYQLYLSIFRNNFSTFYMSLLGLLFFYILANIFYYSRAFAGGDAKLLMAVGAALPYSKYSDIFILGTMFIIFLFLFGAIYSLIYSTFIFLRNLQKAKESLIRKFRIQKQILSVSLILLIVNSIIFILTKKSSLLFIFVLLILPFLYNYLKVIEELMIVRKKPNQLTEGDWLDRPIKIGRKSINCSVHGLSLKDIGLIKKSRRSVLIREGIPFSPAFVIAWIVMVFFFSVLEPQNLSFWSFFYFLS